MDISAILKEYYSPAKLLIFLIIAFVAIGYVDASDWPLKQKIDLSSGFGDFRGGRFHAGVDIRTGGVVGRKVYAPVDGYIYRINMSYRGYGKGLYLKGEDGFIYVFAHLSELIGTIDQAVRQAQHESQRYYIDIILPADSIPVEEGEFIALTGQSGVGAPHLHFEKRTADNKPLNPLAEGFEIPDQVRPTLKRVGFQYTDNHSLFEGGRRKLFFPVVKGEKPGEYKLTNIIEFEGSFGLLIHCYDQMRPGSMRQTVYRINLYIDDNEIYRSQLDRLEFGIGSQVGLMFDPEEAANDEKRVRRLFLLPGESQLLGRAFNEFGGQIEFKSDSLKRHSAKIVATDNFGNHAQLDFEFVFRASEKTDTNIANGRIVDYHIAEHGLVIANQNSDLETKTNIYKFIPLADSLSLARAFEKINSGDTKVALVGYQSKMKLLFDSLFSITTGVENFFYPSIISIRKITSPGGNINLLSNVYQVKPDGFAVREEFNISLALQQDNPLNSRAGLCWWNKKEKDWVWIDEDSLNEDITSAGSIGGGIFAALVDTIQPKIRKLNITNNKIVTNLNPIIRFNLTDSLSGFEDDRSIEVRINGEWLIPEYDFENHHCKATLYQPLDPGMKTLTIKVKDRAGNITELKRDFVVKKKKGISTNKQTQK